MSKSLVDGVKEGQGCILNNCNVSQEIFPSAFALSLLG